MRKWWLTTFGFLLTSWPTVMLAAFNYDAAKPGNSPFKNEEDLVRVLFDFGITIAGIVFVLLFLIGGLMYLGNAGNEEQTSKAKRLLVDAIIGLVLVLSAWAASTFILNRLTKPVPAATVPAIPSATSPTATATGPGGLPTNPSISPSAPVTPTPTTSGTVSPSPGSISSVQITPKVSFSNQPANGTIELIDTTVNKIIATGKFFDDGVTEILVATNVDSSHSFIVRAKIGEFTVKQVNLSGIQAQQSVNLNI